MWSLLFLLPWCRPPRLRQVKTLAHREPQPQHRSSLRVTNTQTNGERPDRWRLLGIKRASETTNERSLARSRHARAQARARARVCADARARRDPRPVQSDPKMRGEFFFFPTPLKPSNNRQSANRCSRRDSLFSPTAGLERWRVVTNEPARIERYY